MIKNKPELILFDKPSSLDSITQLNNMGFFKNQYSNYLNEYPNSNLIFFDFTKFKKINDQFSHDIGDLCLASFGKILKTVFPDSLLTRQHGDEFLILTNNSTEKIAQKFDECKKLIAKDNDIKLIPLVYGFNAGVVPAEENIRESISKAEIMMYEAKNKSVTYLDFDETIYDEVIKDKGFLKKTSQAIESDRLPLASRTIYQANRIPTEIIDVYTRDIENNKLFTDQRLRLLKESGNLRKLDYLNLRKIILSSAIPCGRKIIINVYAHSLLNIVEPFPRFLATLVSVMNNNPEDFIICVNVSDFNDNYSELVEQLNLIGRYGFEVALSGFELNENNPFLYIWPQVNLKYMKISPSLWKIAKENKKYYSLLNYNVQAFLENDMLPIFMKIETEEELAFIKNISDKVLFEGNLTDKEKHISFNRN